MYLFSKYRMVAPVHFANQNSSTSPPIVMTHSYRKTTGISVFCQTHFDARRCRACTHRKLQFRHSSTAACRKRSGKALWKSFNARALTGHCTRR